ncbi:helix-turn-helix domain-containing protein [Desulfovibrio aminophilus]|uniref:helix-turn-helix domain-containing protein n=1 Tax=Desulfovibrio aminophilus TaxID=81425 RepID=UPI003393DFF6
MSDTPVTPRLLTVKEVAEALRVHARTAYRLVTEGSIRAVKIGSQWRVSEAALLEFIEKGTPIERPAKAEPVQKQYKLPL